MVRYVPRPILPRTNFATGRTTTCWVPKLRILPGAANDSHDVSKAISILYLKRATSSSSEHSKLQLLWNLVICMLDCIRKDSILVAAVTLNPNTSREIQPKKKSID